MTKLNGAFRGFLIALTITACSKKAEEKKAILHISGAIELAPSLQKEVSESDTIFLIAKPAGGGPPVAVARFTGNRYPLPFELTEKNLMMPNAPLDVPLNLSVRVDKDGDAFTKSSGDLFGVYEKNPVSLEADPVVITIKEKTP